MQTHLTEEEADFMECFFDSVCMAETLFSNLDNLASFDDETISHVRLGQIPLLSHEFVIDRDKGVSPKQFFKQRKNTSDCYVLGGRLFGKTLISEKVDLLITLVVSENERIGFSSYDALHIEGVLEDVLYAIENHPFLQIFNPRVKRSPYYCEFKNGNNMIGINMNIAGKNPGNQFFQKHLTRLYIEEWSFEPEAVYKKRRDSVSELGCIFRFAGMTNFTKHSPPGKVFGDKSMSSHVINLPQYVNPFWDDKAKEQAIKDFSGEQSIGFRIFVKGEVVEEGVSVFDMERTRRCYDEEKKLKIIEISKEEFESFESKLLIERPKNATSAYIAADIGETAPTEIGIFFEINLKYVYMYNIVLHNLTDKQQTKIFKYIGYLIGGSFIALDCTDGIGRAIYRSLEEVFHKENLVFVSFNAKIPVDFVRDDNNNIEFKGGLPVYREEYITEWSVKRLKDLLYGEKFILPIDYKFDSQFNSVISMQSATRVIYECIAPENHLFQMFQVFAIAQWYNEFHNITPIPKKKFCKTGV